MFLKVLHRINNAFKTVSLNDVLPGVLLNIGFWLRHFLIFHRVPGHF